MNHYNVLGKGDCWIEVQQCDLENLSDSFITEEKLTEKYQLNYRDARNPSTTPQLWWDFPALVQLFNEWVSAFKPDAISCTLRPQGLSRFLEEAHYNEIQDMVPHGYTLSGSDRLINNRARSYVQDEKRRKALEAYRAQMEKEKNRPYERDKWVRIGDSQHLRTAIGQAMMRKHGCRISFAIHETKAMHFVKRNVSWPEVKKSLKEILDIKVYQASLPFIKKVWDNPDRYFGINENEIIF